MGVGMCLYAQLVQTKNKQCKSAVILQCYHLHLSDFCSRPWLRRLCYKSVIAALMLSSLYFGPMQIWSASLS